jgi:glycerol-3-phosphate acyltransferase PlsX
MRMLPGVDRPGIAIIMPAVQGSFILIDAGANIDSKPVNLAQYAVMGKVFARLAFSTLRPRIGLLSVGEEDSKGNDLTKETFKLLSEMPVNFIGNVEGNALFNKAADVVVCDGFVGNILLKSTESMAKAAMYWMKEAFTKNPLRKTGAILLKNAFRELKAIGDSEEYGGARLLGVNGICIIGHGSSSAKAIRNAIRVAEESVKFGINRHITRDIAEAGIDIK